LDWRLGVIQLVLRAVREALRVGLGEAGLRLGRDFFEVVDFLLRESLKH